MVSIPVDPSQCPQLRMLLARLNVGTCIAQVRSWCALCHDIFISERSENQSHTGSRIGPKIGISAGMPIHPEVVQTLQVADFQLSRVRGEFSNPCTDRSTNCFLMIRSKYRRSWTAEVIVHLCKVARVECGPHPLGRASTQTLALPPRMYQYVRYAFHVARNMHEISQISLWGKIDRHPYLNCLSILRCWIAGLGTVPFQFRFFFLAQYRIQITSVLYAVKLQNWGRSKNPNIDPLNNTRTQIQVHFSLQEWRQVGMVTSDANRFQARSTSSGQWNVDT